MSNALNEGVIMRFADAGCGRSSPGAVSDREQLRRSRMQTATGIESFLSLQATKGLIRIQRER